MCKASPLDLAETTRDRLLVLDPDLTVRFADRSFGGAFTVTPKDTLRDQEGQHAMVLCVCHRLHRSKPGGRV